MDSKITTLLLVLGSLFISVTVAATTTGLNTGETRETTQKANLAKINAEIVKQEREVAAVVDRIIIQDKKLVEERPERDFSLRLRHENRNLIGGSLRN